jgi:hypothetical protein
MCEEAKTPKRMIVTKKDKDPPFQEPNPKRWGTLYDVVGSVKKHFEFTSREGSFFSSPIRIFSLSFSFISTKARCVNLAVESGSTNHLFGHQLPTMIRFSDAAIARGSKVPNQPSDELVFTRVPPGLPCLRTSCA